MKLFSILCFCLFVSLYISYCSSFHITVQYDSTVNSAPAQFKPAVATVVQYFQALFTDSVSITIVIGFGKVGTSNLGSGSLGESRYNLYSQSSYTHVKSILSLRSSTNYDSTAIASLPNLDPISGSHTYYLTQGQMKLFAQSFTNSDPEGW